MLQVAIANRQKALPAARALWRRMLRAAAPAAWKKARLSVTVVGNEEILDLNRRFTGRSGDTDVLAFALGEGDSPDGTVGEIIVCASRAAAEARARSVPPEEELALYVAHGFLHLLGYDDHSPGDRKRMYAAEETLLKDAGVNYVRNRPRRRAVGKAGGKKERR